MVCYDLIDISHKGMWYDGSDAFITHGLSGFKARV
jgi:hypothetical protein